MADFGAKASLPNSSITSTKASNLVLNSKYPYFKIDTQNTKALQYINLLFSNDPPEPTGGNFVTYTTVYSFVHGYSYIPAVEVEFFISAPTSATYQLYFLDSGIVSKTSVSTVATLYSLTDATNVYFIVQKTGNTVPGEVNNLSGLSIQATVHVSVEDVGI